MTDAETAGGGSIWRWLGLFAASLGIVMVLGMIAGYSSEALKDSGGPTGRDYAILGAMLALGVGLAIVVWRQARRLFGNDAAIPRRERLSRNIMFGCGALGGLLGLVLAVTGDVGDTTGIPPFLSSAPLSPGLAIALAAIWLLVLPTVSLYWQRVIDEHERQAYTAGAVVAAYFYIVAAPVWWLLWRGGLVPAPDGIAIYFAFNFVFVAVWFWKKYR